MNETNCSCLNVKFISVKNENGSFTEKWVCVDCGCEFKKEIKFPKLENQKCIVCGKIILPYTDYEQRCKPEKAMWDSGLVGRIGAGYGSEHDTDTFLIAICDDCITSKLMELENEN